MLKTFQNIIKEICEEENINYKFLSKDWITMLEKDGITRFIAGYKFDLNKHGFGLIADDKYALYDVLKEKGINTVEHNIVYNTNNTEEYALGCNTYDYVKEYFNKHKIIVLKPNNGTCGHNVYKINNINDIDQTLDILFKYNYSISMCPYYDIKHEYRLIVLNNEIKLMYAKYLPKVIGNNNKTIRELLIEFNHDYFINKLKDSKYDRILNDNEEYEYNWKFNLSGGAISKEIDDDLLKDKLINIAKRVIKETNLSFGSIDIIETTNNELLVLEINSGVMLDNYIKQHNNGYNVAKSIYKDAIKEMFNDMI